MNEERFEAQTTRVQIVNGLYLVVLLVVLVAGSLGAAWFVRAVL